MRALLATLLLTSGLAFADAPPTVSETAPESAAPVLDSVRLFNTAEAFHLEPSEVRVELRFATGAPASDPTMEVLAEVGVTSHLQLELAEDMSAPAGEPIQSSAMPIGIRYSLGSEEGDVPLNPAIEATLIPRPNAPARAGLRLMVAEELVPHLVVAANGYVEQNLNRDTAAGVDGAFGMTGGVSYALLHGHIHVGAEGQVGGAQYAMPNYHLALAAGPNAVLSAGPCAATLTSIFDLVPSRIGFEPMGTLGCTF